MKANVVNRAGETVGEVELPDDVFAAPVHEGLLHQAVVMYLANQRQGTAGTKTRGEVRGGGRKPWRQKGTGRARQGSIRSPLWRKGGVVFGPHPRDYRQRMPKKARRAALRAALSAQVRDGRLIVLEELQLERPRTREVREVLRRLGAERALLVLPEPNPVVHLSVRNLPGAAARPASDLNAYEVLRYPRLIILKDAVERVAEVAR